MKRGATAGILALAVLGFAAAGTAHAGSVYLTGHDVDFHGGQNGYQNLILNWLRGAGTGSEIAAASYDILLLRSGEISGSVLVPAGFGTVTQADPSSFGTAAAFAAALAGKEVIMIASHQNCGGCDLTTADSNAINSFSAEIATFFNAGGDIYGLTGANLPTYYNFLPPGAVASGASISGSSGFDPTNAGDAIGITSSMVNGFQTHNRFTSFAPAFTVFETRPGGIDTPATCAAPPFPAGCEIISIGVRDATITDGGITLPEPGTLGLLGLSVLGFGLLRRRTRAQPE